MEELTESRRAKLVAIVVEAMGHADLPAPGATESETSFTQRCLAPLLESTIANIGFPGLVPLGTRGAAMISCHALGAHFYPDLGVGYFGAPVFAVEVKFLRGSQRQNSIATAIGQGVVYSKRFDNAAVLLIDTQGTLNDAEVHAGVELLGAFRLPLVVRRATRSGALLPHPSQQIDP